jgi:hypothetical protein
MLQTPQSQFKRTKLDFKKMPGKEENSVPRPSPKPPMPKSPNTPKK